MKLVATRKKNALPPSTKRAPFLSLLPPPNLAAFVARARWLKEARRDQLTPRGKWRLWLVLAGRGWGKTRTGAEDIAAFALWNAGSRIGVIAPTFADARDVCVEGESGLLRALPPACVAAWHRSTGDLVLFNGSRIKLYSADQPERLRGPQHHRVWCDELGAWPSAAALDQMWFGLRLGRDPRVIVTTTPRNTKALRELIAREGQDVRLTRGTTFDNADNLPAVMLTQLKKQFEGTRLGRQELNAEILEDTEGALWLRDAIDATRVRDRPPLVRVIVAVDPAMSSRASSDETGIIAAGLGEDGRIYILADWSCRKSPEAWARRVIQLYEKEKAQMIVAETNAGGELVERLLRQIMPSIFFKPVRAIRGKVDRALPVAALYEQERVCHVGSFPQLEDQMTRFTPEGVAKKSPDRVDAMVWAVTELSEPVRRGEPRIREL